MRQLPRIAGSVFVSFLAVACGSTPEEELEESVDVNATFECVDEGGPDDPPTDWSTTITATELERCILAGDTLSFEALGTDFFRMAIVGFSGPGTYTADADADDGTFVSLRARPGADGTADTTTDVGTSSGECPSTCTIEVTEAGVSDAAVGETGTFLATVDCSTLTGAGVGCVTCTSGGTIATIVVPACDHPE